MYFNSKFQIKTYIGLIFFAVVMINCYMVKLFLRLEEQYSIWWAPVFLLDIILHFYIFIQMAIGWANWN